MKIEWWTLKQSCENKKVSDSDGAQDSMHTALEPTLR